MAQVEVLSEQEFHGGWTFETQVLDDDGSLRPHRMTLAWADYNLWSSDGADEPSKVVEAVMAFLLGRMNARELPPKLDASFARRHFSDADQRIPAMIR